MSYLRYILSMINFQIIYIFKQNKHMSIQKSKFPILFTFFFAISFFTGTKIFLN